MGDNWKHTGSDENIISAFIPGPDWERVENTETGDVGTVYVGNNQTVGEAIEKGQWREKPHKP